MECFPISLLSLNRFNLSEAQLEGKVLDRIDDRIGGTISGKPRVIAFMPSIMWFFHFLPRVFLDQFWNLLRISSRPGLISGWLRWVVAGHQSLAEQVGGDACALLLEEPKNIQLGFWSLVFSVSSWSSWYCDQMIQAIWWFVGHNRKATIWSSWSSFFGYFLNVVRMPMSGPGRLHRYLHILVHSVEEPLDSSQPLRELVERLQRPHPQISERLSRCANHQEPWLYKKLLFSLITINSDKSRYY